MVRGRPRKQDLTEKEARLREQWREASARYYKENRELVLNKARGGIITIKVTPDIVNDVRAFIKQLNRGETK